MKKKRIENNAVAVYVGDLLERARAAREAGAKANRPDLFERLAERLEKRAADVELREDHLLEIQRMQNRRMAVEDIAKALGVAATTVLQRIDRGIDQRADLAQRRFDYLREHDEEFRKLKDVDRTGEIPELDVDPAEATNILFRGHDPAARIAAAAILGQRGGKARTAKMSRDEKAEQGRRASAARKTIGRSGGRRTFECLCGKDSCQTCYMRDRQRASRLRRTCAVCDVFNVENIRAGDTVRCSSCGSSAPGYTDEEIKQKLLEAKKKDRARARAIKAA
jgi:hypothetical protein